MTETPTLDEWGDPPPGDPNGSWEKRSTQIAFGHSIEDAHGWEYRSTYVPVDEAFDSAPAPVPYSDRDRNPNPWERNTYMGNDGYDTVNQRGERRHRTYWRRRTTQP